jgi:hypothetical protein
MITFRVEAYDDFQNSIRGTDSSQVVERIFVAGCDGSQQTSPREMDVDLIGDAVKLEREVLNCRLDEQDI